MLHVKFYGKCLLSLLLIIFSSVGFSQGLRLENINKGKQKTLPEQKILTIEGKEREANKTFKIIGKYVTTSFNELQIEANEYNQYIYRGEVCEQVNTISFCQENSKPYLIKIEDVQSISYSRSKGLSNTGIALIGISAISGLIISPALGAFQSSESTRFLQSPAGIISVASGVVFITGLTFSIVGDKKIKYQITDHKTGQKSGNDWQISTR